MTTFEGSPEEIAEGIRVAAEQVLPLERGIAGFAGFVVLVDREANRLISLTLWASEEAMRQSDESARVLSRMAVRSVGGKRRATDDYEVAVLDL